MVAGVDSDASCAFAFEKNIGARFLASDICMLTDSQIRDLFGPENNSARILIGCAPCQPFSVYTGRYRNKENGNTSQWKLLEEFLRAIRLTQPLVVSMENVPRLTRHELFSDFIQHLEDLEYFVTYELVHAQYYGIPQKRTRLVLFASRLGQISMINPTHKNNPRTVRDAISHLPPIAAGEIPKSGDRLHRSRNLSPLNLQRLKASREGGFWREWDDTLKLECHRKSSGRTFRSVYGRMRWDEPSPVITTQCLGIGNGRFGHPEQDRAISIREAAILQSFPRTFRFVPPRSPVVGEVLSRQIGNAVPVRLGRVIARSIKKHFRDLSSMKD